MNSSNQPGTAAASTRWLAVLIGWWAALALVALYAALVGIANSPGHALDLLWGDRYFVAAIAVGFGVQAGLYAYVRLVFAHAKAVRASGALAATGTGTSTAAMVACCAHHVVDVLPIIGLSGAAILLNDYRVPIMLAGLAVNAVGIVLMLGVVRSTGARVALGSHLVAGGNA
jgi:hypothetical protein